MTSPHDDNALDRAIDDAAWALTRGEPSPQFTVRVLARRAAGRAAWRSPWTRSWTVALASLAGAAALFLIAEVFRPAQPGRGGSMTTATSRVGQPPAAGVAAGRDARGPRVSPAPSAVRAVRAPAPAVGAARWNARPSDADAFATPLDALIAFEDIAPPALTVDPIAVPDLDVIAPIAIAPIDEGDRP